MLDPFVGIGHSALAARKCRIGKFVGFDVDPEYIRIARNTVEAAQLNRTSLLL
jgi:predicted O-methyltransferase YrrM